MIPCIHEETAVQKFWKPKKENFEKYCFFLNMKGLYTILTLSMIYSISYLIYPS